MAGNLWTTVDELGTYATSDHAYDAVKTASYLLWAMTGRKYSGTTTVTELYVATYDPMFSSGPSAQTYSPVLVEGSVENIPAGRRGRGYDGDMLGDGSTSRTRLRLRGRRVIKIHNMRDSAGNIIPNSQYYLGEHSTLIATRGAKWISSNVEVTYSYGSPPPQAGKSAARLLATELVKLYEGDDTCALPQRISAVTRAGVSYTVLDNQDFLDDGKTGLYPVDLFIKSTNPDKARSRSRVFSPDMPSARRIVPKPYLVTETANDLPVLTSGGAVTLHLSEIGATFILSDPAWVLSLVISNYMGTKSGTITDGAILNSGPGTISLSVSYSDALAVLGPREPGVYDVYATRPTGTPGVDEVIDLITGNTYLQLATRVVPIYTP